MGSIMRIRAAGDIYRFTVIGIGVVWFDTTDYR